MLPCRLTQPSYCWLVVTAARTTAPTRALVNIAKLMCKRTIQVQELLSTVSEETNIAEVTLKVCTQICFHAGPCTSDVSPRRAHVLPCSQTHKIWNRLFVMQVGDISRLACKFASILDVLADLQ